MAKAEIPYNALSMNTRRNIVIIYGGGQIPEADPLMGKIISLLFQSGEFAEIYGVHQSYAGMENSACYEFLTKEKAMEIQEQIGTYFGTCRNYDPSSDENFPKILEQLKAHKITDLIVCGGDGSLRAARDLEKKLREANYCINIFWIPCTIDGIEGTESIGTKAAVLQTYERSIFVAANAWATFDHGLKGPRVAVVEIMGRNRDTILCGAIELIKCAGKIGKFNLDEIRLYALPSDHEWSVEDLVTEVNKSEVPGLIMASEGAKPKEKWFSLIDVTNGVAKKIAALIDIEKQKRANADIIGYLSQSNSFGLECDVILDDFMPWIKCLEEAIGKSFSYTEAKAIIKNNNVCSIVPLTDIAKLNPNSKEIVPLSDKDKEIVNEFLF